MAELKPGGRWKSAVCSTEVIVVKAGAGDVDLRCGGVAMIAPDEEGGGEAVAGATEGTQLGKRYVDADDTIEILCTKPGDGSLGIGDALLELKEAKPLPASD